MKEPNRNPETDLAEPVLASGPRIRWTARGGGRGSWLVNALVVLVVIGIGGFILLRSTPGQLGEAAGLSPSPLAPTPLIAIADTPSASASPTESASPTVPPPTAEPTPRPTPTPIRTAAPKPQPGPTDSQLTPAPTRAITVFAATLSVENSCLDMNGTLEWVTVHVTWEGPIAVAKLEPFIDGVPLDTLAFGTPPKTGSAGLPGPVSIGEPHTAVMKFDMEDGSVEQRTSAPFTVSALATC